MPLSEPTYELVEFRIPFKDEKLATFLLFQNRFRELWDNFEDLKKEGMKLSAGFSLEKDGAVHGGGELGVSRFRLKGYFLDYRHFSEKGPTNFLTVCNSINSHVEDSKVRQIINFNKTQWNVAGGLSGWHNEFTAEQVISAEFSENYFHSNPKSPKALPLASVQEKLANNARLWETTKIIFDRMLCIRNINFILGPVYEGQSLIRIPTKHAAYKN